jgi:hypothetical protein
MQSRIVGFVENPKEEIHEKQPVEDSGGIGHCKHGSGRLRLYGPAD